MAHNVLKQKKYVGTGNSGGRKRRNYFVELAQYVRSECSRIHYNYMHAEHIGLGSILVASVIFETLLVDGRTQFKHVIQYKKAFKEVASNAR